MLQKIGNLGICKTVKCNSVSLNIENYKIKQMEIFQIKWHFIYELQSNWTKVDRREFQSFLVMIG